MTRVKYSKYNDILVTDFITVGPNDIIRGVITQTFEYSVNNFDGDILEKGQASNLRNAKSKVKALLKKYGARFDNEIRQTTP